MSLSPSSLVSHDLHAPFATSLSFSVHRGFPEHPPRAQRLRLGAGTPPGRDTFTVSLRTPHRTPPPAKFRPKAEEAQGGGRGGGRAGRGVVPGRLRSVVPAPGASFRSHKGGNGSQKGSAWSRSPSEEVGVGTRTRVLATPGPQGIASLGERLRSRQHSSDREIDGEGSKETIETETLRTETQR